MKNPKAIAKSDFDVIGGGILTFTIFQPEKETNGDTWACRFEFSAPLNAEDTVYGENGLQALLLALKIAASQLYGSELYKSKKLGVFGELGGQLIFPAPKEFLDIAPFPF